jgi:hypothetical protein
MATGASSTAKLPPPISPGGYNKQLFQALDHVAILNEQIHDVRLIPVDWPPHLAPKISQ